MADFESIAVGGGSELRRALRVRHLVMLAVGGTIASGFLLFSASRSLGLSMALLALAGCAMIVNNSLTNTLLQIAVPDHLRGRVMGFYSFVFVGLAPFGAFLVGLVAEHYGAPVAVGAGGVLVTLGVIGAAWRVPELRTA